MLTDSVIFLHRPGDWTPPLGSFLGNMTNELKAYGDDAYIQEFLSAGPKNYGYRVQTGRQEDDPVVVKVGCFVWFCLFGIYTYFHA